MIRLQRILYQPEVLIFCISAILFLMVSHVRSYGYEAETWDAAWSLAKEGSLTNARAGITAVVAYVPFVFLRDFFTVTGITDNLWFAPAISIIFYSALIPAVMYRLALLLYRSAKVAIIVSLLLASATMLLPYTIFGMEHLLTLFVILITFSFTRYIEFGQLKDLVWMGLWLGAAGTTKPYAFVLTGAVVLTLFLTDWNVHRSSLKEFLRHSGILFLPVVVFVLIAMYYNYARFGNFMAGSYTWTTEFQYNSLSAALYGYVFSSGKSVFLYSPVLLLGLPFISRFIREHQYVALLVLFLIVFFLLPIAPFLFWSDETWGPRRILALVPLLFLPAGYAVQKWRENVWWQRELIGGVVIWGWAVQVLAVLYDYGKQLTIFRRIDLDILPLMQYVPELSHLRLNWLLLKSYLVQQTGGDPLVFYFTLRSWFRFLVQQSEVTFVGRSIPLTLDFAEPDLIWFVSQRSLSAKIALFIIAAIALLWLLRLVFDFKHNDPQQ